MLENIPTRAAADQAARFFLNYGARDVLTIKTGLTWLVLWRA